MKNNLTEKEAKRLYEVLLKKFTEEEANEAVAYIVGAKEKVLSKPDK